MIEMQNDWNHLCRSAGLFAGVLMWQSAVAAYRLMDWRCRWYWSDQFQTVWCNKHGDERTGALDFHVTASLIRECPVFRNFEGVKHNINYINITLNVQVDCHVGGGRDGGARRDCCQARDHRSGCGFNICKRETVGYFLRRCQDTLQPCDTTEPGILLWFCAFLQHKIEANETFICSIKKWKSHTYLLFPETYIYNIYNCSSSVPTRGAWLNTSIRSKLNSKMNSDPSAGRSNQNRRVTLQVVRHEDFCRTELQLQEHIGQTGVGCFLQTGSGTADHCDQLRRAICIVKHAQEHFGHSS